MTGGIALLLRGSPADLSAIFHAIELAKRTTGVVHAVLMEQGGTSKGPNSGEEVKNETRTFAGQFIVLVNLLGEVEGVAVHIHGLDSMADELWIRFFCENRIFCLIIGVGSRSLLRRKTAWVARLQRLLTKREDCFLPRFWSVIIPPGNDREYVQLIDRCARITGGVWVIEMLLDNLRNGLKGLEKKKESKKEG